MAMRPPLRVGIVGVGNIGSVHVANFRALEREGMVTLAGVADHVEERRAAFAAQGIPAFPNLTELLGARDLDAVVVAVPNRFHAENTIEALEARKHVLCEKPPAIDAAEARRMSDAAGRSGRVLLYGLVYRHMVPAAPFVESLGEVYLAEAQWLRRRGIPGWGVYTDPHLQGGGAFIDLGVHVLDLAWWLMGCPRPLRVGGATFSHLGRRSEVGLLGEWDRADFQVEDTAVAAIMFPNRVRLQVHAAFAANVADREAVQVHLHGVTGGMRLRLMTTESAVEAWRFRPVLYTEGRGHLLDTTVGEPDPPTVQEGYMRQARHFVACCWGEATPVVTPEQGVTLQEMIDAFYNSASGTDRVILGVE
jgi:predicted dehydrogenase